MQVTHAGSTVLDLAKENGFQIVTTGDELAAVESGRVLGLFANGHLPVRWQGEGRARALPLKARDDGQRPEAPRFGCEPSPSFEGTPDLGTLTRRAIELLSSGAGAESEVEDHGFFLMVESASIDKQAHAASPCGQIGETQQLEEAVQAALDYAATHPDTLIIVASDHGHAGQVIPYPSLFDALGMAGGRPIYSPGKFAVVETPEGGVMGVNYATKQRLCRGAHRQRHSDLRSGSRGGAAARPDRPGRRVRNHDDSVRL